MAQPLRRIAARAMPVAVELVIHLLIGFSISTVLGMAWGVIDGTRLLTHIGHVAAIGGGIWLLGGSSLLSKMTMIEYMQYGLRARSEDLIASDYADIEAVSLTPFGSSLIVGTAMIVVGTILM